MDSRPAAAEGEAEKAGISLPGGEIYRLFVILCGEYSRRPASGR